MIVDTHAQLWTREVIESLPRSMVDSYSRVFGKDFSISVEKMLADMDEAGVEKAVVVGVDAETTYSYKVSNDAVYRAYEESGGRLIPFAGVDPHKGKVALKEIDRIVKLNFKGLKFMPHLHELNPNDPKMYEIYRAANDYGLPLLFHTGTQFHKGSKIKYCRPLYLDDVAVDFPDLKIIIAHFGYPWYEEALAVVRRNENVYFNIAGWSPKYIPEVVIRQMNSILSDKVLFGTDYPLMNYKRVVEELKQLNLKETTYEKMFYRNAKRIGIVD
ncbi:putative metal-dependent hydrolase of the TIM-barrel fold protein [Archaeoglobus sulfaticallidus PM70-1]|uniref:Putative metal-dependent hydrolase of the TIM-barrel fold protein n=1 Tax=Archaeoglobus sulfaticallidus PM70-1 TaxID=387631 RepID=N0BDQ9_9EURY|nr:amidohydrolase family protein [Archaeoglobus sulfaticallidus]AGK61769.1 putative metal-dependent hydrolase of the TIM-barrel fold protein [Archaeoglobus sulfaticallidus PM70-1]